MDSSDNSQIQAQVQQALEQHQQAQQQQAQQQAQQAQQQAQQAQQAAQAQQQQQQQQQQQVPQVQQVQHIQQPQQHQSPLPQQHQQSPLLQPQQHDGTQLPVSPNQQQAAPQAPTSTVDSLTCQWTACGERCQSPEALYDHVCERHVGRKSTNNLNLTCQWGQCRTTTVKRDHITSHIRVHVPLKPHKCDFCGKAFKRPQDLKKHVKTHADDSVLMRSPEPNSMQNRGGNNAYQQNGKPPAGYYGPGQDMSQPHPYPSHPAHMTNNQFNNYAPQQQQYSGYGQVNYPTSNSLQDLQSMDTRKRAIEALNDFLGDIKRRAIDPSSYYDVGQRLQSANLPLPISSGFGYSTGNSYNGGNSNSGYSNTSSLMDSFGGAAGGLMSGGGSGGGMAGPLSQSYSLPLPNARTKNDLQEIDRFLEQLQSTVYENSSSAAASGVQQPGLHSQHTQYPGFNNHYRNSDSPPSMSYGGSSTSGGVSSLSSVPNMSNMTSGPSALDTPALTPSSVTSYASSSHSPMSTHSRSSMSSVNGSNMYPSLPSVTAVSDMGAGYPSTTSAPPSGLASGLDGWPESRRYSGGRLQREAPAPKSDNADDMDMEDDGSKTPRNAKEAEERPGSSSLDPALRSTPVPTHSGIQSPNASTTNSDGEKSQENWVENIRVIESLRNWIKERLEHEEFEVQDHTHPGAAPEHMDHEMRQDDDIAYPVLKAEA